MGITICVLDFGWISPDRGDGSQPKNGGFPIDPRSLGLERCMATHTWTSGERPNGFGLWRMNLPGIIRLLMCFCFYFPYNKSYNYGWTWQNLECSVENHFKMWKVWLDSETTIWELGYRKGEHWIPTVSKRAMFHELLPITTSTFPLAPDSRYNML